MKNRGQLIGEFMLIVIGVLVAFMVESWLQQRHDDDLRDEYLVRLTADLEVDHHGLENRIEFFAAIRDFGLETLVWLKSSKSADEKAMLAAYYAAERWAFAPVDNTYQDLQNTGNIRLLDDLDFRMLLTAYHTNAIKMRDAWDPPVTYRKLVRGAIPPEVQLTIRELCPTTINHDTEISLNAQCPLPKSATEGLSGDMESLRSIPGIVEILSYHITEVDVAVRLFQQQDDYARDLLSRLNGESPSTQ